MKKLLLATLLIPTIANATCYNLFDKNNNLVYSNSSPPFDLSGPPDSPAYAQAKAKGIRLQITPTCTLTEDQSNAEIASNLNRAYTARLERMRAAEKEKEYQLERRRTFVREANEELLRRGEINVKKLRAQNDLEEKMW